MKVYRLRELREKQGLTQEELAQRAQLTRTTVWRIENDQIGARIPVIRRLARALKVKYIDLISDPDAASTPATPPSPAP
jgi:transcriptional regulator with XRE-family HTH domain